MRPLVRLSSSSSLVSRLLEVVHVWVRERPIAELVQKIETALVLRQGTATGRTEVLGRTGGFVDVFALELIFSVNMPYPYPSSVYCGAHRAGDGSFMS